MQDLREKRSLHSDHNNDERIKDGLLSIDPNNNNLNANSILDSNHKNHKNYNVNERNGTHCQNENGNIMAFTTSLSSDSLHLDSEYIGTVATHSGSLVDYGAPFSVIGMIEPRLLRHIDWSYTVTIDPKPQSQSLEIWNWVTLQCKASNLGQY